MTSSEGLLSVEPWMASTDSWLISELSRDSDLLTRALQKSIYDFQPQTLGPETLLPSQLLESSPAPTVSYTSGGSDLESYTGKRGRSSVPVAGGGGKARKRRARVSKRSQTTFINANPENFRQMVQQVTGARYGVSANGILAPIVKPEPHRLVSRLPCGPSDRMALPTLDTSSILSNHHQESLIASPTVSATGPAAIPSFQQSVGTDDGRGAALEFDVCPMFPTLESWKVM